MKIKRQLPPGHSRSSKQRASPRKDGVYLLKVELEGSSPPIWRRIQVPGDITLGVLHSVLQEAMGWENCHMHEFKIGKDSYGSVGEGDDLFAMGMKKDKGMLLKDVLPSVTRTFQYIYDFGDDWVHKVTVEKMSPHEAGIPLVYCLEGERACPPEDCGGIYGYYDYLEVLKDPGHPEYEEIKEWMGRHDPARFDLDRVNARLKRLAE
jgi:hypothetical protein